MKKDILKIENLTKYYGDILAVDHLNLQLYQGEILGFIGPNGAGKSTTIRSIMHLINKSEGCVYFNGQEFKKDDISIKKQIGYLPSEIHLYDDFTVKEMLDYHETFYQQDIHQRRCELVQRLKLDESKKIEDLSLGNSKKLGIVLAFMHQPQLLILDEPTSGLDPIMQHVFYELLKEEKAKGTTIFYSTHILGEISQLCDRVAIIKDGKLIKMETVENMRKKQLHIITIEADEIDRIIGDLHLDKSCQSGHSIRFKNELTVNELMSKLINYKIDKLLIEEATIEDIFLHYYQ